MDQPTYTALKIAETDDPASMLNINDPAFAQSSHNPYTLRFPGLRILSGSTSVYVPAQYTSTVPASLMVWFDGGGFAGYRREHHTLL